MPQYRSRQWALYVSTPKIAEDVFIDIEPVYRQGVAFTLRHRSLG
jgi:hypothetical protein